MKTLAALIIGLILLNGGLCFSQSTLAVYIMDCRSDTRFVYLEKFKLFRNDSLLQIVETRPQRDNRHLIEDLPNGQYRIDYTTMFGKIENAVVDITESGYYRTTLCINSIDYSKESYLPFIDRLQNGETYTVRISSWGCHIDKKDTITITKECDKYFARYGDTTKELNDGEVKIIRQFEIGLQYMEEGGCTHIDTYVLMYGDKKIEIVDGNCDWRGKYYLKRIFLP